MDWYQEARRIKQRLESGIDDEINAYLDKGTVSAVETRNLIEVSWTQNDDNKMHRIGGPAFIRAYKHGSWDIAWFEDGLHHRIDGPAIMSKDLESWYFQGKSHRTDGPAFVHKSHNGAFLQRIWSQHGERYREGDLPTEENRHTKMWHNRKGKLHRDGGPAYVSSNQEIWYQNNKIHREDGPAFKHHNNDFFYLENTRLTEEKYWQKIQLLQIERGKKEIRRVVFTG